MAEIEQLGPYRIDGLLGRGGMALVYRAFHLPLRRRVALKVLEDILSHNEEFQERFEQEARIAAALEHPNIIQIYDLGTAEGRQYIAMRLIEGPTLEDVIRDVGAMPLNRVLRIVAAVADALGYAHSNGVYHRDVKPSNVLLRSDDSPILSDFGIARAVEGLRLTMTHRVVGTPRYMSPEQALGRPVDHRSDIYSLGIAMYEMLVGEPPFDSPSTPALLYLHVHEPPQPLGQRRPDLPAGVVDVVDQCIAKAPEDRFQSARELADWCRDLLTESDVVAAELPLGGGAPIQSRVATPPNIRSGPLAPTPGAQTPARSPTPAPAVSQEYEVRGDWNVPPSTQPARPPTPQVGSGSSSRMSPITAIGLAVVALLIIAGIAAFTGRTPGPNSQPAVTPTITAGGSTVAAAAKSTTISTSSALTPGTASTVAPAAAPLVAVPEPDEASVHLNQAMSALGRRDFQMALDNANAGLKVSPSDRGLAQAAIQARMGIADSLLSSGTLEGAIRQYLAVREPPLRSAARPAELREAEAASAYIWALLAQPVDSGLAIAQLGKAFRTDPAFRDVRQRFYEATLNQGKALRAQGDVTGARAMLNTAKSVYPERTEVDDILRSPEFGGA